ncbi:uncharacterized protein LOC141622725 [Silene latifolia]|uniref:uncharacterized protein LOC141622725 n=1 Tax=Silene latifolia TaxID=37657 RepID=UPI003D77835F
MMLVSVMAEMLEEYTAVISRVIEHIFNDAPLPRRVRFLILRNLPFPSFPPHPSLLPSPPAFLALPRC